MDETYDIAIFGSGLTECILSGIFATEGKKIIHIDKNDYYGGECTSINLGQLREKSGGKSENSKYEREFNIDLVPKFIMAGGSLANVLINTNATRYLDFKQVKGSFVYRSGKIYKVPSSEYDAVWSPMFGLMEKYRARCFFEYIRNYNAEDSSKTPEVDLSTLSMEEVYDYFALNSEIRDFIGHALALYPDETYMSLPAIEVYHNIMLYLKSMAMYGKSPYIYPLYGLGELPQSFARLSAVHGGTFMLSQNVGEPNRDALGNLESFQCGEHTIKCSKIIADPTYFPEKAVLTSKIVRAVCILTQPVPGTSNSSSAQIIIPQRQVNRKSDIYVAVLSSDHQISPKNTYVAYVSTTVETDDPFTELNPAFELLGKIKEKHIMIQDVYVPRDYQEDGVHISRSYDPSSHFESVFHDVCKLYEEITGNPFLIEKNPRPEH